MKKKSAPSYSGIKPAIVGVKQPNWKRPHKGRLMIESLYTGQSIILPVTIYKLKKAGLVCKLAGKYVPLVLTAGGHWMIDYKRVKAHKETSKPLSPLFEYSTKPATK